MHETKNVLYEETHQEEFEKLEAGATFAPVDDTPSNNQQRGSPNEIDNESVERKRFATEPNSGRTWEGTKILNQGYYSGEEESSSTNYTEYVVKGTDNRELSTRLSASQDTVISEFVEINTLEKWQTGFSSASKVILLTNSESPPNVREPVSQEGVLGNNRGSRPLLDMGKKVYQSFSS